MSTNPTESLADVVTLKPWDHVQGPDGAAVTILEYGDYECPHCGQAYPILKKIRETMGDQVRLAFRHFPQNNIHPHASVAAQAVEAAGAQGKFWEMHNLLLENQAALEPFDFDRYALKIGLEIYQFRSDLSGDRFARRVERDYQTGAAVGIHKTPTLFINGRQYAGKLDPAEIENAVRAAL